MLKDLWNRPALTVFHEREKPMSFFAWILLGLVAGYLGSKIVNRRGEGILFDILLGIVGATAGGFLFQLVGVKGITGLNLWSLLVATIGSIFLLIAYHAVRRIGFSRR